MSLALWLLMAGLFLLGSVLGMFTIFVLGIRTDDRRRNIRCAPRTPAEMAARRMLVRIRCPEPDRRNTEED